MGEAILIYGKSGSGKSRSLINFGEEEIFLVNVIGKRLPFAKKFKYELSSDNIQTIKDGLTKMPCKVAVIDDAGYLMTNTFMRGHGKGDQFQLYNTIGDSMWDLLRFIKQKLPNDALVYLMMHEEADDFGNTKLRTIGKLLDQKVCLEGMVTICLHCIIKAKEHLFVTNGNGNGIEKSPEGMLEYEEPNDLKAIDSKIRTYWGI
jgi:hypothetical protein